jgi:hypothetical protein
MYDDVIGRWSVVDPMAEKYKSWSMYNFCLNNAIRHIDPKGLEPYLVFDGKTKEIKIFDDAKTTGDSKDDILLGTFKAHNNVTSTSKGKWEDGSYDMYDQTSRRTHKGQYEKDGKTLQDSENGRYGTGGIYRAKDFKESTDEERTGMAVHAGRENKEFESRKTEGCIRTTPEAMKAIDNAIKKYGALQKIIVQNNRPKKNVNDNENTTQKVNNRP